jgi:hypothetical protein
MSKANSARTLYIHKLKNDNEGETKEIISNVNNYFNDSDDYFNEDKICVGKIHNIEDMSNSLNDNTKNIKIKKKEQTKSKLDKKSFISNSRSGNFKIEDDNFTKLELINNKQLRSIFENFRDPITKRNFACENCTLSESQQIPRTIKTQLDYQDNNLKIKADALYKNLKMSKYLCKKINKKEDELLMNRIDVFRMKKQIYYDIENSRPIEERYGKYKWNISLRRPDNFKGIRNAYVNVRNDTDPFWVVVYEKSPHLKDLSIKPGYDLNKKDYVDFKKNQFLPFNSNENFKTIESLDSLRLKGENLYNVEFKREMASPGNKILHKVFVDNGKLIFDKDINCIFPNKTIYKNYYNKDKLEEHNKKEVEKTGFDFDYTKNIDF